MGISKEEAVRELTKRGYKSVLERGVVYFLYQDEAEYLNLERIAREILDDIGYVCSWGIIYDQKHGRTDSLITVSGGDI